MWSEGDKKSKDVGSSHLPPPSFIDGRYEAGFVAAWFMPS